MGWKVPINTDLIDHPELTPLDHAIWINIILRCQRKPAMKTFKAGKKTYNIKLGVGQMVFNMREFAIRSGKNRRSIMVGLNRIQQTYQQMHQQAKPFGLLITVLNYDEVVSFAPANAPPNEPASAPPYIRNKKRIRGGGERAPLENQENNDLKASISLKKELGIDSWVDSRLENEYSLKLATLYQELGSNEFTKRFRELAADAWHRKRFNEIKYVYEQIAGYIPPIDPY